ncbi:uncharacterized protein CANTADRAFT_320740 [Suhomyces tanzawaensis NRRL Y-17324]|uniref:Uncharacterized protein n=1 Tax=Suhomyces tanzawaensis NRRL Y-17324 TaxID=984487 RepID=A0A1E4SBX3_9ASCO|nr:uncharacterized protein CANTADRAFT_320740 [Suhomyces tanzawaensis NRRL Y-17324]ODV76978.1 hypothetical protein CANTADRAFT_320740 [Suhomyces tanzawaensis NRRL Y-17324]
MLVVGRLPWILCSWAVINDAISNFSFAAPQLLSWWLLPEESHVPSPSAGLRLRTLSGLRNNRTGA